MDRCPELFELESFFEVPSVALYGLEGGWYYDHLRFSRIIGPEHVIFELEAAEKQVSLVHSINGKILLEISLQYVCSLDIESSGNSEVIIGRVNHGGVEQLFKIMLKPHFTFRLGTALPNYAQKNA